MTLRESLATNIGSDAPVSVCRTQVAAYRYWTKSNEMRMRAGLPGAAY